MAGSMIDQVLWQSVIADLPFNPDAGIYRYWRSLRQADPPQYIGVPVTPEIETEVGVQQGFSSGAVINWSPESGAEFAND
jgi:LGFP repeat